MPRISPSKTEFDALKGQVPKRTLLWTNPSPKSAFAAQTVQIAELANYTYVAIEWKAHSSYDNTSTFTKVQGVADAGSDNATYGYNSTTESILWTRSYRVTTTGVQFYDSFEKSLKNTSVGSKDNERNVPYRVYGIEW